MQVSGNMTLQKRNDVETDNMNRINYNINKFTEGNC